MKIKDITIKLHLEKSFTSIKHEFEKLIGEENIHTGNLVCWVPHEVASLIQIGWEDGLIDDLEKFLEDIAPKGKWTKHDEPGTPFRHNSYEHIRTKLPGTVSMTLIVKDGKLYLGKYQDIFFYAPVFKHKPDNEIFCRVMKFD